MGKNIVALIPARGGSKRLPGKNIKELNGVPLIAYSILAAKRSKHLNRIICSTDNNEIAEVAKKYDAEVPFLRPEEYSTDKSTDRDVMAHLITWLKESENYEIDYLVNLRPTTPLKTFEIIDKCIDKIIKDDKFTSIRTVTKSEGVFHPYWMFQDINGVLKPFIDGIEIKKYYQSQLLPDCYRLNGVVDVLKVENITKNDDIYGDMIGYVEIDPIQSIDIDEQLDFDFCEFIIKRNISNLSDN